MSFTIDKHFCGGELMDISYFGEADGCDMDDLSTVSSYEVVKENSCCVDETQIVESTTFDKERITKVTQKNIARRLSLKLTFNSSSSQIFDFK